MEYGDIVKAMPHLEPLLVLTLGYPGHLCCLLLPNFHNQ